MSVKIKDLKEQEIMRTAGKKLAKILDILKLEVKEGITTKFLDKIAFELILNEKAKPAFLGYNDFPGTICTSINDEIVHGIPSDKRYLKNGDILSIDIGLFYNNYCVDMSITVPIGAISVENQKLIDVTRLSLLEGIKFAKVNNRLGDIGHNIQKVVENAGFNVVMEYTGHGIGQNMHEPPEILHYGKENTGMQLKAGMVFAIEPMVNVGTWMTKILDDGWTVVTKDGKNSAHFEHTVLIRKDEPEILTKV
ncbi:MAG: type I methionyl aminopeptidase [Elusimicrobiota bacterium]|jgi:methionyl aminopeptidase|nr:type I methionyl aminopeptidase [Elusimicrobiota bacterium]